MSIYSDHDQRLLDQQTGEEMDRQAQRRERREARDTIATAPIGPAHVFADADNNGLNARVLPAALTSNEQVEQLISEYQLAIDVRSHHTPLGRIDRIKQRCEETISALRELQERRVEVEKYKAWAASCDPTPPETTAGPDRRPLCENCGEQYHKHGKGNLACPGSEMGNVYRAQAAPAMPHASLALKEFMSELGEIMSIEDGATPADYLRRAREIRQWCSDHQGSAVKTSCTDSAPAASPLVHEPPSLGSTAAGAVCTKHGVTLAFEDDECWACKEEAT